jgi:hypothetical protein
MGLVKMREEGNHISNMLKTKGKSKNKWNILLTIEICRFSLIAIAFENA